MKHAVKFSIAFLLCIMAMGQTSCSKNDEPWNEEEDYPDIYEDDYEIVQGPDETLGGSFIRLNNLIYSLSDEDGTCKLWYKHSQDYRHYYYSSFSSSVLDIPNEITFNGKTYKTTYVDLSGVKPSSKGTNASKIKYITLPFNVLSFEGGIEFSPITLSIGANVREVSNVSAEKIFWLPNTPPSGYTSAKASVQYASSTSYEHYTSSNQNPIIIYPHLSSMFNVDGIVYVMTDPSNRKCDLVGVFAPPSENILCDGKVIKDGISFDVEKITKYAFYGCENITNVNISDIAEIGDYAFYGCSISKVKIPKTVTYLGIGVFKNCKNLCEVILEDGNEVLQIARPNKKSDINLTSYFAFDTFSGTNVNKIYIGRNLDYETIGDKSPFYRMDTLADVEIRRGETEISDDMFYGCISLKSVIIGDDINRIGNKAFSGCSSMTSFKFGKKLKTIGADAFSDCTSLTSFTSEAIIPPTCGNQALDDINKWECVLHVPAESVEAYKNADQWKNFLKIE